MKKLTITALLFSVATPLIARPLPSTIEPLAVHAIKGIKTISCRPISISDGDIIPDVGIGLRIMQSRWII